MKNLFKSAALIAYLASFQQVSLAQPLPSQPTQDLPKNSQSTETTTKGEAPIDPSNPSENKAESKPAEAVTTTPSSNMHGELRLFFSLINSYKRGLIDDWFQSVVGDASRNADQGSSSFFDFAMLMIPNSVGSEWQVGVGASFILANSHAIWGTKTVFGGRSELAVKPLIFGMPLMFRRQKSGEDFAIQATIVPQAGWNTGKFTDSSGTDNFTVGLGYGASFEMGADYFMNKFLLNVKIGYRLLKLPAVIVDSASSTGASQYTLNGNNVTIDYSGFYGALGVGVSF